MIELQKKRCFVLRTKTTAYVQGRGTVNIYELRPSVAAHAVKSITLTPMENFLVETLAGEVLFFPAGDVAHAKFETPPTEYIEALQKPEPKIIATAKAHEGKKTPVDAANEALNARGDGEQTIYVSPENFEALKSVEQPRQKRGVGRPPKQTEPAPSA